MKKLISLLLILSMILPLAACTVSFDAEGFKDAVIDAGEAWVDEKIEEGKQAVSDTANQAINSVVDALCFWKTSPDKCAHETATQFNKKLMTVTCDCGKYTFTDLSYDEFVSLLTIWQKKSWANVSSWRKSKNVYHAEMYLAYRGIDANYINLMSNLPDSVLMREDSAALITRLGIVLDALSLINSFSDAYVTHIEGRVALQNAYFDLIGDSYVHSVGTKLNCANIVSQSIQVAGHAFTLYNVLDTTDDPEEACLDFISIVQEITGFLPTKFATYYSIALDSLSYVLEIFFDAYKNYEYLMEVYKAGTDVDGFFCNDDWSWFQNCHNWKRHILTQLNQIEQEQNGLSVPTGEKVLLPTLEDAIAAYPTASPAGQDLLSSYIVFYLDVAFQEYLGITYKDFVQYLEG